MPGESAETLLVRRDGDSVLYLNVLRAPGRPGPDVTASPSPAPTSRRSRQSWGGSASSRGRTIAARRCWPTCGRSRIPPGSWSPRWTPRGPCRGRAPGRLHPGHRPPRPDPDRRGGRAVTLALRQIRLRQRLLRSERRPRVVGPSLRAGARARARPLPAGRRVRPDRGRERRRRWPAYGYSREELLRLHVVDLRAPETQPVLDQDWQAAASPDGALFETVHVRRDGSTFPVEVSSRAIDVDGVPHHQSFVRDITERHASRGPASPAEHGLRGPGRDRSGDRPRHRRSGAVREHLPDRRGARRLPRGLGRHRRGVRRSASCPSPRAGTIDDYVREAPGQHRPFAAGGPGADGARLARSAARTTPTTSWTTRRLRPGTTWAGGSASARPPRCRCCRGGAPVGVSSPVLGVSRTSSTARCVPCSRRWRRTSRSPSTASNETWLADDRTRRWPPARPTSPSSSTSSAAGTRRRWGARSASSSSSAR